ncbi:MAG: hypothetical protein GC138_00760 [Gammaproteobacteria bacterium]|nr:hypothetical protein [Gammaproteobacteria bacterium]
MKFHIICTVDHEVFGNGSGCVDRCVVAPMDRCLAEMDRHKAILTFFVDAPEFSAMRMAGGRCAEDAAQVEAQLADAANGGHKVQLHLHSQWLGAERADGHWRLDFSRWRIGDLARDEIMSLTESGIEYLRAVAGSDSSHLCTFRAGGWAIQPARETLVALSAHGVTMDSTVAPGCYHSARGDWYDFRHCPDAPWWPISDDVCRVADAASLIEVPIATAAMGRVEHARALREHRSHPSLPEGCEGSYEGPNSRLQSLMGKVGKVLRMGRVMLDFSTMPSWMLIGICEDYRRRYRDVPGPVPIVAIGHGKNFTAHSEANLSEWLSWVDQQADMKYSDFYQWHSTWRAER